MSWQAYVDTSLVGTGQVDQAAIFGAAGDSVWAASPGFAVDANEMKAIAAAYNSKASRDQLYGSGVHIAKVKYIATKNEDRSIYGAKGKAGVVIVKTKQAILVAHYPDSVPAGNAATTVEKLADYLIGVGY